MEEKQTSDLNSSSKATYFKILQIAQEEFLNKGFRDSSLRTIVKRAGVTTGAFYGYFESKEELFDSLVKEHAEYVLGVYDKILLEFSGLTPEKQVELMETYTSAGFKTIFDYVWAHKTAFRLILNASGGTRYENFLQQIAQKDIESTEEFYNILEKMGKKVVRIDPIIEQIVITGTFSSFFTLLLMDIPKAEAER